MTAAFDREDESTAVIGDGVVTLDVPIDEKEKKMPVELGQTISELLLTEAATSVRTTNDNIRNANAVVMSALQGVILQNFKDIGVTEGRSVSGILATPIAGPANAQK